jgi:hypothetical protein
MVIERPDEILMRANMVVRGLDNEANNRSSEQNVALILGANPKFHEHAILCVALPDEADQMVDLGPMYLMSFAGPPEILPLEKWPPGVTCGGRTSPGGQRR